MEPKTVGRETVIDRLAREIEFSGLLAGAIVMTLDGEIPVEHLADGDRIITRDTGMSVIRKLRYKTITCDVVSIMAGSLGHTRPERDVTMPADQRMLIRDWRAEAIAGQKQALIPARQLVDGEFVCLHEKQTVTVYEIELDRAQVIYADGLEMVSYIRAEELSRVA
ncbi:Hint domain-containing protein [Lutimaribacter sp. EGI FJ00015]|uniref:Hint domain-containing protein n=1 Tax=Lutimaribacter degradans TaxID=2945989 RepID=A0ACC5ZS78_9RHOB|nr:Hint domain-containing protein [Lutimaribacter sp. EGI FJ00013]MCM2561000.1 Hint domain-containing protein [Lutimaribacter sp. EGI FJ00013]MCO0612053.1 Hint domain-containing protein [Lutimaribacter sp. EGI FJ00015]MCO0634827.1 Hint domain-containing protein [Lutimaribacter sp. EGI FJ00014]